MKPRYSLIAVGVIVVGIGLVVSAEVKGASAQNTVPIALSEGRFKSVAHKTVGTATVYQLPDGRRILRLTGFETSNGPDVRVYLVAADDAPDSKAVTRAGFVDLGALKGTRGDQNYELSPALDLAKYRSVSIWCRRFSVNFGAASLARPAETRG